VIKNSTIIAFFTLAIFSMPLISAPKDFAIACDKILYSTWDTKSKRTISNAYKGRYVFVYTNDPTDTGQLQWDINSPYIYYFGKIPKKPLEETIWLDSFFEYKESSETHHFFIRQVRSLTNSLRINRQTLEITTIDKEYDWEKLIRHEYMGEFSSCEVIDLLEANKLEKLENEDYANFKKELKEKEEKRNADLKSKQKI
tara:strand:+ start:1271 stop:1867 length:597 start_codon:yes stop_codon:yes gene_type:complete